MPKEDKNLFIYRRVFPDIKSIFNRKEKKIEDIFKNALFVLDTNSLLAPFKTGKENIEEIRKIYQRLKDENRLFIPEHVIREFAKNRSIKISELYTQIDNYLSQIPTIPNFEYPILEELESYKEVKAIRNKMLESNKEYKEQLKELKSGITNWNWSDPVTSMYQKTFSEEIVINIEDNNDVLVEEFNARIEDEIPPGNKDSSKKNNAIGDFIIWKTILELGKEKNRDIIFISNDEKNDWLLKGNKKSISTKFELVDEYYRITEGNHFISMTFTNFLEKQGLEAERLSDFDRVLGPFIFHADSIALDSLKIIEDLLHDFLLEAEDTDEEELFIRSPFDEYSKRYLENYRKEFFEKEEWPRYFKYLNLFEEILIEIISLNGQIIHENYRMKRSTKTEQIQLRALVKEFISKYNRFINVR
jgi:rRNA-processing protein FCF1